jgi:hypothetical protein
VDGGAVKWKNEVCMVWCAWVCRVVAEALLVAQHLEVRTCHQQPPANEFLKTIFFLFLMTSLRYVQHTICLLRIHCIYHKSTPLPPP